MPELARNPAFRRRSLVFRGMFAPRRGLFRIVWFRLGRWCSLIRIRYGSRLIRQIIENGGWFFAFLESRNGPIGLLFCDYVWKSVRKMLKNNVELSGNAWEMSENSVLLPGSYWVVTGILPGGEHFRLFPSIFGLFPNIPDYFLLFYCGLTPGEHIIVIRNNPLSRNRLTILYLCRRMCTAFPMSLRGNRLTLKRAIGRTTYKMPLTATDVWEFKLSVTRKLKCYLLPQH